MGLKFNEAGVISGSAIVLSSYCVALYAGRIRHGGICDISDLELDSESPERQLFALGFDVMATTLLLIACEFRVFARHKLQVMHRKVDLASLLHLCSSVGVFLVGHFSPNENKLFHFVGAGLGFGCGWLAQCLSTYILYSTEDAVVNRTRVRIVIAEPMCGLLFGVGAAGGHQGLCKGRDDAACKFLLWFEYPFAAIAEWMLLCSLLYWYFAFPFWSWTNGGFVSVYDAADEQAVPRTWTSNRGFETSIGVAIDDPECRV